MKKSNSWIESQDKAKILIKLMATFCGFSNIEELLTMRPIRGKCHENDNFPLS